MSLATIRQLLADASKGGYAVGSFSAWDIYSAKALVEAAEEERSPAIMAVWREEIEFAGIGNLFAVCLNEIKGASVPVSLFLDHAHSLEEIKEAVRHGANSVMIDSSSRPLAQNIGLTKEAADYVHSLGIPIEGELGVLGEEEGSDPQEDLYTRPDDALAFVSETKVDCLAVAIGNAHGFYKQEPKLDLKRLKVISDLVKIPIALHGGSGIPKDQVREAIRLGAAKVNIGAEVRKGFYDGIKKAFSEKPNERLAMNVYASAKENMKGVVREKMRLFGSSGKA